MNELEGLDPRRRIASVFLLPQCDMSCRFCASEADFSVMTFEQAENLLRALRARSIGNIVLGGGEPFLWPHGLERLSRRARELGFLVQVCTNGVSLPDGFQRIASIERYILPLESMDPDVHDRLRLRPDGHHALVLERIGALAGSGRELTVSTVVTRQNIDRLAEIADYLVGVARAGVSLHAWHLYRFLPVGRGGAANAERLSVTRQAFRRAVSDARRGASDLQVYRRDDMLRSTAVEFFWYEGGRLRIGSRELSAAPGAHHWATQAGAG